MSRASLAEAPAGCQEVQRLLHPAGAPAEALVPSSSRPTRTPSVLRVAGVDGALTSRKAAKAAAGAIADALAISGVAVFSGGVAADAIAAARAEVLQLHAGGGMVAGRMSMAGAAHQNWRQDHIAWLTPARCDALPALAALDAQLQALSEALNAELMARQHMRLGGRHDCQLSLYPGTGAGGFKRHADTKDIHTRGRKLTMLLYLNPPGWAAGGALRIYGQGGEVSDIVPRGGTVVVLRSDIQHEVLPTVGLPRTAMTVWFDGVLLPQHPLCAAKGAGTAADEASPPRSSLPMPLMEGLGILDDACSDFDDDAEALVARPLGAESGDVRGEPPSPPAAGCGGGAPGRRRRRRWWPFPFGAKA